MSGDEAVVVLVHLAEQVRQTRLLVVHELEELGGKIYKLDDVKYFKSRAVREGKNIRLVRRCFWYKSSQKSKVPYNKKL